MRAIVASCGVFAKLAGAGHRPTGEAKIGRSGSRCLEVTWRSRGGLVDLCVANAQVAFDRRAGNVSIEVTVGDAMPKKPGKRASTKRASDKTASRKKGKPATKKATRATSAPATTSPTTAQVDAETEYFHRTLRENAQVGSDTLLSPGQTHVETTDAEGKPAIVRRRFSAR
jgi:hypothetical protein